MNAMTSLKLTIPMPQVASIEATAHLVVRVIWLSSIRNHRVDIIDLSPLVDSLKFYRPLRKDRSLFDTVHLIEDGRAIAWGNGDIDMPAVSLEQLAEESMTAEDFKDFLKSNNLTHGGAAALLGRSRRQIENYLSNAEPIPRIVVLACFGLTARKQNKSKISATVASIQTSPQTVEAAPTVRVAKGSLATPTISKQPSGTTVEAFADTV